MQLTFYFTIKNSSFNLARFILAPLYGGCQRLSARSNDSVHDGAISKSFLEAPYTARWSMLAHEYIMVIPVMKGRKPFGCFKTVMSF
jgi:hypothetical protein